MNTDEVGLSRTKIYNLRSIKVDQYQAKINSGIGYRQYTAHEQYLMIDAYKEAWCDLLEAIDREKVTLDV